MEKMYSHPMLKDKFIPKEEYFAILNSKEYDKWLGTYNQPLNN